MGIANFGLHRIVHDEYSISANSSTCQKGREIRTDRYDKIAKSQGPSIELMVDPSLEIFSGVTMVKRYPSKLSPGQKGNKKMRFGSVRLDNLRSMAIKYFA